MDLSTVDIMLETLQLEKPDHENTEVSLVFIIIKKKKIIDTEFTFLC